MLLININLPFNLPPQKPLRNLQNSSAYVYFLSTSRDV